MNQQPQPAASGEPAVDDDLMIETDLWPDDMPVSTDFGPDLVSIELRKPMDPVKEENRLAVLMGIAVLHRNKDATAEVCAYGLLLDTMMHLMHHSISRSHADRMQDIKKIMKTTANDLRLQWCSVVRRFICSAASDEALLSIAGLRRAAGTFRVLTEHLASPSKAQAFAVHISGDNLTHCIASHSATLSAWEETRWLTDDLEASIRSAVKKVAAQIESESDLPILRTTLCSLEPLLESIHAEAAKQQLPVRAEWMTSRIFCGPGSASSELPKSPQKLGGMRQHCKRKHSELREPFDGQEFLGQITQHTDGRFFDIRVRGQSGMLRHTVMKSLSTMAAELSNIYSNGHTLDHRRREVTNHLSAPRPGALFEFVVPHLSTTRQEHHTQGDGMFKGFDVSKRLSEVTKHYESLIKPDGPSKIRVLRGFSPTKCEKKGGSLATFVNHITSAMICVGIDSYGECRHEVKSFGPYNMVVVVVDLVRASYGSSKSHNQFPGLGLACIRHRKAHVLPCDANARGILTSIMKQVEEENSQMRSPEHLLDHALVHSELVTSGGLLCNLSHLMAGVRSTLSSMADDDEIDLQVESHIPDTADSLGAFLGVDTQSEVKRCFRHFAETHGSSATTCARTMAVKVVMQMMMTHEELDRMAASDVAALAPNQCMFDAAMIPTSLMYFDKLTKNLHRTPF